MKWVTPQGAAQLALENNMTVITSKINVFEEQILSIFPFNFVKLLQTFSKAYCSCDISS